MDLFMDIVQLVLGSFLLMLSYWIATFFVSLYIAKNHIKQHDSNINTKHGMIIDDSTGLAKHQNTPNYQIYLLARRKINS